MLGSVFKYKGEVPTGFQAASALIDDLKKEKEGWTLSPMDMEELRKLGFTGDDPITKADYDECVSTQIVRAYEFCPFVFFFTILRMPSRPVFQTAGGQQDRSEESGHPWRCLRQAREGAGCSDGGHSQRGQRG